MNGIVAKPMPISRKTLLTQMPVNSLGSVLIVSTLVFATSCTSSETVSKIECEALADGLIASNTGDDILKHRLIKFQALEEYVPGNTTGKRGGQRAICTVKNDPPGYKWVPCWIASLDDLNDKRYTSFSSAGRNKLFEVEKAIEDSSGGRWTGACKVKL